MTKTMRAAVCTGAGGPEVLEIRELPVPRARVGWSLVRVKAAGLNRSELRTRQGHSPGVRFPRVLGIECVGVVEETGATVAAVMGDMGRAFDGGYAEYALLPDELLMPITTTLPWEVLAALPETFLTAQGALDTLSLDKGDRLLIRGGTSSVGLAAAAIATSMGVEVTATSRRSAATTTETPTHVLDLVGTDTVLDSLRRVERGGTVCVAGSLSGWLLHEFEPIAMIPSGTRLTAFHSNEVRGNAPMLRRIVGNVEAGVYGPHLDRVFRLDDVVAAHRYMEENRATGKVVLVP